MNRLILLLLALVALSSCSTTKVYMPVRSATTIDLINLPAERITVVVNDLRTDKGKGEEMATLVKSEIESALGKNNNSQTTKDYKLVVDIIEYRSFFSLAVWNGSTKMRARIISGDNKVIGSWEGVGTAQRSNMMGYSTAKAVAQDSYNNAIADLFSNFSSVNLD